MKKPIKSTTVAEVPQVLSQAIESNGFIFVSGMVGVDTEWNIVEGGVVKECKKAMENIEDILGKAGAMLDQIVKVTIYATDIASAKEINEVYSSFFSDPLPAREMVGVKSLPLGAKIEISVIAVSS